MSTQLILTNLTPEQRNAAVNEAPPKLMAWPRFPSYSVSSDGGIYSFRRGPVPHRLAAQPHPKLGYLRTQVWNGTRQVHAWIHRAVLEAWVGECPAGQQCAHLNGNKLDARLENLRWVTPAENMAHQRLHGTALLGIKNHSATLSDFQMLTALMMRQCGIPTKQIAHWFNVSADCILAVHKRRNRKEIFNQDQLLALLRAHGVTIIP